MTAEELLLPISAAHPGGEDVTITPEWVAINTARRKDKIYGRQNADWPLIQGLLRDALVRKAKDLRLAVWLIEANVTLDGFTGLLDGFNLVRGLVTQFWDNLFPEIEGNDLQFRIRPLEWLGDKDSLPFLIRQIPLTRRTDNGRDYSYLDFSQSRSIGWEKDVRNSMGDIDELKQAKRNARLASGGISAEMFDQALTTTRRAPLETLQSEFDQAFKALEDLDRALAEKLGQAAPGLSETKEAFDDCGRLLADLLKRKRAEEPDAAPAKEADSEKQDKKDVAGNNVMIPDYLPSDRQEGGSWEEAEALLREGRIEEALAAMTRIGAGQSGRVHFQHRLRLAEICLNTDRQRMAIIILEELAKIIDEYHLEKWESAALLSRVWGRLYHLYKTSEPGSERATRGTDFFDRLCKLDPWQALVWDK